MDYLKTFERRVQEVSREVKNLQCLWIKLLFKKCIISAKKSLMDEMLLFKTSLVDHL